MANVLNASIDYNPECEPGQDNRRSDLCAQWKAADGAYKSAFWTEKTFWLGFIGLLIGAGTLGAAIAAAYFARSASDHAKAAAEEAKRNADYFFDSGRGFIEASSARVGQIMPQGLPTFTLSLKNIGSSSCRIYQRAIQENTASDFKREAASIQLVAVGHPIDFYVGQFEIVELGYQEIKGFVLYETLGKTGQRLKFSISLGRDPTDGYGGGGYWAALNWTQHDCE